MHVRRTCKRPGSPPRTSISAYTLQGLRCEMSTPVSSAQKGTKTERESKRCMNKYQRSAEHNERELCKVLTHRPKAISLAGRETDIAIGPQLSAVKWPVAGRTQVFMSRQRRRAIPVNVQFSVLCLVKGDTVDRCCATSTKE